MEISLKQARSFIVESQLLSNIPQIGRKRRTLEVIEHLGYVQIDTISVVSRAHHHVLWSRVPGYEQMILRQLEADRAIFEYWAHAASYLPMKDYRFSLVPKKKIFDGPGHWWPRDKKWTDHVYGRIKAEGGLMSKDFKKDPKEAHDHPWGGHPVSQALRQLFMEGRIMISGRRGFQKVYDLTERVIPSNVDQSMPSIEDYYIHLIKRDLKANGIMKSTEIGHLITIPKNKLTKLLNDLTKERILTKVNIHRIDSGEFYALESQLMELLSKKRRRKLHILSPFDNLVIQRKRLKELFNFEYLLECYVPAPKRKVGYYSLPILWGEKFVGQIDLKAERKKGVMIIRNLLWEEKLKRPEEFEMLFKQKLQQYCYFNNCEHIEIDGKVLNSNHPFPITFS